MFKEITAISKNYAMVRIENVSNEINEIGNIEFSIEEYKTLTDKRDKYVELIAQIKANINSTKKEIERLEDFVARNKARVSTRNMAMSRQKKLDKMDVIELAAEKPKPEFNFKVGRTPSKYIFETKDLVIGYDSPLSKPLFVLLSIYESLV